MSTDTKQIKPAIQEVKLERLFLNDGQLELSQSDDVLATEEPVALVYNGISHIVTMITPLDLDSFAIGFSLTENIVQRIEDIYDIEIEKDIAGIQVQIKISSRCFNELKERRRYMMGKTSCGVCGLESLQQFQKYGINKITTQQQISPFVISHALNLLNTQQSLRMKTGASHAAAWCDLQGNIDLLYEDIGRHNALDKLIGKISKQGIKVEDGFLLLSSRASYEMIQKAATANIACVVAISAPTARAVEYAEQCGITLIAFASEKRLPIYTHRHRIQNLS